MKGTVSKWGNSQGVRIPKAILESASFEENQEIRFVARDGEIVLKKEKPRLSLAERFSAYKGSYQPEEMEWGDSVGGEV